MPINPIKLGNRRLLKLADHLQHSVKRKDFAQNRLSTDLPGCALVHAWRLFGRALSRQDSSGFFALSVLGEWYDIFGVVDYPHARRTPKQSARIIRALVARREKALKS